MQFLLLRWGPRYLKFDMVVTYKMTFLSKNLRNKIEILNSGKNALKMLLKRSKLRFLWKFRQYHNDFKCKATCCALFLF